MLVHKTHDDYIGTDEEHIAIWLCEKAIRNGECWECHLVPNAKGYSNVTVGGRAGTKWRAHRLIYTVIHGDLSNFTIVRHKCDNRRCIRPAHLVAGTNADNTSDMMQRGRHKFIPRTDHKLDAHKVDIIQLRSEGKSLADIAQKYRCSPTTVLTALRRYNNV